MQPMSRKTRMRGLVTSNIQYSSQRINKKLTKRSYNRDSVDWRNLPLRKLVSDFLFFSEHCRICFVMIEWPSNEAYTLWAWNFSCCKCAVICLTPGTCLTTGLVVSNSFYQCIMISALREIEAVCFNRLLIPWYQIPHPSPLPLPIPNPCWRLLRSQTNFHFSCSSVSKQLGVFLPPG